MMLAVSMVPAVIVGAASVQASADPADDIMAPVRGQLSRGLYNSFLDPPRTSQSEITLSTW
jgi:hypothetical protein